jgi:hypothetical protein
MHMMRLVNAAVQTCSMPLRDVTIRLSIHLQPLAFLFD